MQQIINYALHKLCIKNPNYAKIMQTHKPGVSSNDSLEYVGTEVTDEEIISCVRPTTLETEPEEEEEILQTITTAEVLKSLDTVISYVKNPPQNLVFELIK